MSLEALITGSSAPSGHIAGITVGLVSNVEDPDGLGRIRLKLPLIDPKAETSWVRMVSFSAGKDRGGFFLPEPGDEVLVAFANGNIDMPFVIGALWDGKDKPPVPKAEQQERREIKTKAGNRITFVDKKGGETITITDKKNNRVLIDTKKNSVTIEGSSEVNLKAPNGTVKVAAKNVEVAASGTARIKGKKLDLRADSTVTIKGKFVNIN